MPLQNRVTPLGDVIADPGEPLVPFVHPSATA
jgi:hypothetical protein